MANFDFKKFKKLQIKLVRAKNNVQLATRNVRIAKLQLYSVIVHKIFKATGTDNVNDALNKIKHLKRSYGYYHSKSFQKKHHLYGYQNNNQKSSSADSEQNTKNNISSFLNSFSSRSSKSTY